MSSKIATSEICDILTARATRASRDGVAGHYLLSSKMPSVEAKAGHSIDAAAGGRPCAALSASIFSYQYLAILRGHIAFSIRLDAGFAAA